MKPMSPIQTPTIDEIVSTASGKPLIENSQRGLIAEIMVAKSLEKVEPGWRHTAGDWGGWDFEHRDGTRLEVKQSASRQSWAPPAKPKSAQFSIAAKAGYWRGPRDCTVSKFPQSALRIFFLKSHRSISRVKLR